MSEGVKTYTADEVRQHASEDDCWIIIHGKVYDVTKYLSEHPGGVDIMMICAGEDATTDFEAMYHSDSAKETLKDFYIGDLATDDKPQVVVKKPGSTYYDIPLKSVEEVSHDTKIFTFHVTPEAEELLAFSSSSHVDIRVPRNNESGSSTEVCYTAKSYTPISTNPELKEINLLVKQYPNGTVSKHIHGLRIGDTISIRGPIKTFTYEANKYTHIAMIAGGTGITPMYQVAKAIKSNPQDTTNVTLLFANRTVEDILMRKDLESLTNENFKLHLLLSRAEDWPLKGHISQELFNSILPPPDPSTYALICGPPGFVDLAKELLGKVGFPHSAVHIF